VATVNGQSINSLNNLSFVSGRHILNANAKNGFISDNNVHNFDVEVTLDNGFHHILKVLPSNESAYYRFIITKSVVATCPAIKVESLSKPRLSTNENRQLPPELAYRLDVLVENIVNHYEKQGYKKTPVINLPLRELSYFGASISSEGKVGAGLHILSVTPHSPAERLGLQHGDRLLAIDSLALTNSLNIQEEITHFKKYIASISQGENVSMYVIRDFKKKTLTSTYTIPILPNLRLEISN